MTGRRKSEEAALWQMASLTDARASDALGVQPTTQLELAFAGEHARSLCSLSLLRED